MKIGLSLSRCVRDIVDGKVDITDVLVIVARTDFDPRDQEQWDGIWQGYGGGQTPGSPWAMPEWGNYTDQDEDRVRSVCIELWKQGKLHQPRQFGARPRRVPYYWLEAILLEEDLDQNIAVREAWNQFQVLAKLSNPQSANRYREDDNF